MARRCYQRGQLRLRGNEWVGRWYETVIVEGVRKKIRPQEVIGTLKEYPTKPLAKRALTERIAHVNRIGYRPTPIAKFVSFSRNWEEKVLSQFRESTAINYRTHIHKHLIPFLGEYSLKDISPELVQEFVSASSLSPKTIRNVCMTLASIWGTAKKWGYVQGDVLDGVVFPRLTNRRQFFFTHQEVQRIVETAPEPYRMFYSLLVETGLRVGELCGLSFNYLDLQRGLLHVRQVAWRGRIFPMTKTEESARVIELSPRACDRLRKFHESWRPNAHALVFATRNGTPWDQNMVLKRHFKKTLRETGILVPRGVGFHGFRHTNATWMNSFGAPTKLIQDRLGHEAGSSITDAIYTHVVSEDSRRIAAALGEKIWIMDAIGHKEKGAECESAPKLLN